MLKHNIKNRFPSKNVPNKLFIKIIFLEKLFKNNFTVNYEKNLIFKRKINSGYKELLLMFD